jgi:tripartite-type tricarboxylate transporter receptor subunit TctC
MRFLIRAVALAALLSSCAAALAQTFPVRTIRIIVPFAPGGANDLSCRTVAVRMAETFKSGVIIDNRPGAGGQVGTQEVVRAAPDGYTLLCLPSGPLAITPHLQKVTYDVAKDLAAVAMVTRGSLGVAVNAASPLNSLAELIQSIKEKPAGVHYSVPAIGTQMHLSGELLKQLSGANLQPVAYKGTAPAVTALLSGEVTVSISDLVSLMPHHKSKRVKVLAVSSAKRSVLAPEIPTIAESGYPGYASEAWYAMFAPEATPRTVIEQLNAEVLKALALPEVRNIFLQAGLEAAPMKPDETRQTFLDDYKKWGTVIKTGNIKVE